MSKSDDHVETAVRMYQRYWNKQLRVEEIENAAVDAAEGNEALAAANLKDETTYKIACGGRNGLQEQFRSEAQIAIMALLFEIRNLIRKQK